jgi:hypothetical protein
VVDEGRPVAQATALVGARFLGFARNDMNDVRDVNDVSVA